MTGGESETNFFAIRAGRQWWFGRKGSYYCLNGLASEVEIGLATLKSDGKLGESCHNFAFHGCGWMDV